MALRSYYFVDNFFSEAFTLNPALKIINRVLHSSKTIGKIVLLYVYRAYIQP